MNVEIGNEAEKFHFWRIHKSDFQCSVAYIELYTA
jgi:hypothetical protein